VLFSEARSGSGWEVFNNLTPEMFTCSLVAAIQRAQLSPYPFYKGSLVTYKRSGLRLPNHRGRQSECP
jgi:hypothetical protein